LVLVKSNPATAISSIFSKQSDENTSLKNHFKNTFKSYQGMFCVKTKPQQVVNQQVVVFCWWSHLCLNQVVKTLLSC
jgi:hypothetical protein